MNKTEFKMRSVDGVTDLHVIAWLPSEGNVIGVIQIAHGITEHMGRYEKFAEYFTDKGYVVVGNDILGHGLSVSDKKKKMYFGKENSWFDVVKDFFNVYETFREKYSSVPYVLLGFSLGSFVVRSFLSLYPDAEINDVVLVGTGFSSGLSLKLGRMVANAEARKVGEENSTEKINKLALENYNKYFDKTRTKCDWLCANERTLDDYLSDPLVGKDVSCGLFRELLTGMIFCNRLDNIEKIKKSLPILLVSGKADPVGGFTKEVVKLEQLYRIHGIQRVRAKFYDGMRHDVLHEEKCGEIYDYMFRWLKNNHKFDEKS